MTRLRRRGQPSQDHGQAAVEFALVLPFILLFVFLMVEGVRMLEAWMLMEHASREGARYGAVRHTQSEITDLTQQNLNGTLVSSATITVTGAGGAPGTDLHVKLTYDFQPSVLNGFMNWLFGAGLPSVPLTAQTHMRLEE